MNFFFFLKTGILRAFYVTATTKVHVTYTDFQWIKKSIKFYKVYTSYTRFVKDLSEITVDLPDTLIIWAQSLRSFSKILQREHQPHKFAPTHQAHFLHIYHFANPPPPKNPEGTIITIFSLSYSLGFIVCIIWGMCF